jgi:hypothetical protein
LNPHQHRWGLLQISRQIAEQFQSFPRVIKLAICPSAVQSRAWRWMKGVVMRADSNMKGGDVAWAGSLKLTPQNHLTGVNTAAPAVKRGLHAAGLWALLLSLSACALLQAPVSKAPPDSAPPVAIIRTPSPAPAPPDQALTPQQLPAPEPRLVSDARTPNAYRTDAASHLYARHSQNIYKGRLPPMLEAVGVLNVNIDRHGSVKSVQWMRAPRHVPQVMQQIERMVKAAAPYPVPQHMSQVTYTDVWLWHQSGKFQLDLVQLLISFKTFSSISCLTP